MEVDRTKREKRPGAALIAIVLVGFLVLSLVSAVVPEGSYPTLSRFLRFSRITRPLESNILWMSLEGASTGSTETASNPTPLSFFSESHSARGEREQENQSGTSIPFFRPTCSKKNEVRTCELGRSDLDIGKLYPSSGTSPHIHNQAKAEKCLIRHLIEVFTVFYHV